MSSVHVEPIGPANIDDVATLLYERNRTMPAYTRWKYGHMDSSTFRGVVAYCDDDAVGCFGLVPRELVLTDGSRVRCGWFADWYVVPRVRGEKLGSRLLAELQQVNGPVFGHPGPAQAQAICRAQGYRPLGFQSRRRIVLRRWAYECGRTRIVPRAAVRAMMGWRRSAKERASASAAPRESAGAVASTGAAAFRATDTWATKVTEQPITPGYQRVVRRWDQEGSVVTYADDLMPTGLRRWMVLHSTGAMSDPSIWRRFTAHARAARSVYIECFTSDRAVDAALQSLGAWRIAEADVLVIGLPTSVDRVALHGWDRENFTYLATAPADGWHA